MNSFTLYLPSDGCPEIHPNNTSSQFLITLNGELFLPEEEDWEVALMEITYSNNLKIFSNKESIKLRKNLQKGNSERRRAFLKKDSFPLIDQVIEEFKSKKRGQAFVKKMIKDQLRRPKDFYWSTRFFKIWYKEDLNRFAFVGYRSSMSTRYQFPWFLLIALGFKAKPKTFEVTEKDLTYIHDARLHDPYETHPLIAKYPPQVKRIKGREYLTFFRKFSTDITMIYQWRWWYRDLDIPISPGYFDTIEGIVKKLNSTVKAAIQTSKYEEFSQIKTTLFHYDPPSNRILLDVPHDATITMNGGLHAILGFNETTYNLSTRAPQAPHIGGNVVYLYIYTNIVDMQRVGHQQVPLLRSIPFVPSTVSPGGGGGPTTLVFENPHYLKLCKSRFQTIEMAFYSDFGGKIEFEGGGKTLMRLHFRRRTK